MCGVSSILDKFLKLLVVETHCRGNISLAHWKLLIPSNSVTDQAICLLVSTVLMESYASNRPAIQCPIRVF